MIDLKRVPWTTLVLSIFALLIAGLNLQPRLELTASLHEPWRLWSGHFTHWSQDHLCWDLAVFVVLGAFCELRQRRAFLGLVGPGAVAMSVPLLVITDTYRGLSGLDTGLFVLAGCILAQAAIRERNGRMLTVVLLAMLAFVGKSMFEAVTGATLFVDSGSSGFQPLVSAHLLGAFAGLGCFGLFGIRKSEEVLQERAVGGLQCQLGNNFREAEFHRGRGVC